MSMSRLYRTLCSLAMIALGVPAGAQAQAVSQVAWYHLAPGCAVTPGQIVPAEGEKPQRIACGGAGSFLFGKAGLLYDGPCAVAHGTESPSLVPAEPPPHQTDAFPCSQGSCLGRSPGRPWVAVLDWPTAHGWSVAATILEASDRRVDVELLDLTAAGTLAEWVPPVSDLHVLLQLCSLAESVKANHDDRPLAVNMSFGRRDAKPDCETEHSLGCSIGGVLSHLAGEGIVPVSAAGNHHELLFPASSPGVVSAGALDLAYLQQTQNPRASTQTPAAAKALMVGYGLYLSAADGTEATWPAPPGSSYAAALFTGWLSGTLALGGTLPAAHGVEGGRWSPLTTANGLALALDGVPLPGSELDGPQRLLDRATGAIGLPPPPPVLFTLELDGLAPPLPELPVLYADDGNGPQPGVCPCVPCHGEPGPGGSPEGAETVLVDLSASSALPRQMDLVAVMLRIGKNVYVFHGSREPALLAAMAAGGIKSLALSGVGGIFVPGEQPSLLLVVNVGGLAYWHEVPVHLHG